MVGGLIYVREPSATLATWFMGLSAFAAGVLLLIGFVTPIVAAVVAAATAALWFSFLPAPIPNLFDSRISIIFVFTMLVTIVGLGPGAFSVDARLFGRREIIIPPRKLEQ